MTKTLYFILALFLILAFGITACGGSSSSSQSSSQNSSSSQATATPTPEEVAPSGDPAVGKELFGTTCVACHGPEGKGVPGLGKDMTTSEFIASKTDSELLDFIKVGRDPSDPLNTTGVAMPPKGGNPALSNENLLNIVSFVRTLQE